MSTEMTYAEFERLLAVYGGDRTRWPPDARAGAAQLAARSREARLLLAETEMLDRVLARAPLPTLAAEAALAKRILGAAQRSPRVVAAQPRDGARRGHAMRGEAVTREPRAVRPASWGSALHARAHWRVGLGAAVSAASLLAGVLLGLSNLPQPVLRPVQQLTGLPLTATTSAVAGTFDPVDEDLL